MLTKSQLNQLRKMLEAEYPNAETKLHKANPFNDDEVSLFVNVDGMPAMPIKDLAGFADVVIGLEEATEPEASDSTKGTKSV